MRPNSCKHPFSGGWILAPLLAFLSAVAGCGGDSGSHSGTTASHEEIEAFLEQNPRYADPVESTDEETPLGLGP